MGFVSTPMDYTVSFLRRFCRSRAVADGMFETKSIGEVKSGLALLTKLAKEKIDKNR